MSEATSEVSVRRVDDRHRYEARVGDTVAGFAAYRLRAGIVEFTHTEVGDEFEGQGVGSALARAALDDVRRDGSLRVVATCPFIAGWVQRHPAYQDLLAG